MEFILKLYICAAIGSLMYNTPHKNSSMTSEEIIKIIDCEFQRVKKDDSDYSMAHGAMGVALFMIWYGQKHGIHRYIDDGLWLIDSKCMHVSAADSLDFHNGQVGIGMGILWLSLTGITNASISNVLRQIDDNIFKQITRKWNHIHGKHVDTLLDIACYVALRLKYRSFADMDERIYSKFLSMMINKIYPDIYAELVQEVYPGGYAYKLPRFIFLILNSYGNNFDSRLNHIVEESRMHVLSQIPYMASNRLALANAIGLLAKNIPMHYRWAKHATLLVNSIELEDLDYEYKTNQMSLYNGMGWFALQLLVQKEQHFDLKKELYGTVKAKLAKSGFSNMSYDELEMRKFLGLYGILGFLFVTLKINEEL